jgi:hypothetical protein
MYDAISAQLSKNTLRYQVGRAVKDEKVERIVNFVKEMEDSMTVYVAYHSDDPNAGLALTKNEEYFKMYASDTGLFVTLAFKDSDITENVIYDKLLNDKLSTNLGYIYENVIAQMLRSTGYFPQLGPGLFPAHFASSFVACARGNNPGCKNNLYCRTAKNCEAPLKPAGNRPYKLRSTF